MSRLSTERSSNARRLRLLARIDRAIAVCVLSDLHRTGPRRPLRFDFECFPPSLEVHLKNKRNVWRHLSLKPTI